MAAFNGILGTCALDEGFQFAVWAPNAKSVALTGDFNQWQPESMTLAEGGIWWCVCKQATNTQQYKFVIGTASGETLEKNDPRARRLTNSVGNSIIYQDDFDWQVNDYTLPAPEQRVIYEMHIGTFARSDAEQHGTFDDAIGRLDDLKALGINVVEVMPVFEFAGDISWGYNPAHPFAVEEAYGGPNGLKRFIDAAHQRGIGVIMDVVYNHFGPGDLDLWQFDGWHENDKGGIYFYNDERSNTPWGDTRPDYGRQEVRDYLRDNALMWLSEFKADGLRMDMVPYMRTVSAVDDGSDTIDEAYTLLQAINGQIRSDFPQAMIIAEDMHQHDFITASPNDNGCGFTAQWDAAFVHPVRELLEQSDDAHIDTQTLINALEHQYNGCALTRVIYTESHDEVANGKARLVEEVAPGNVDEDYFARNKAMLAAALVLSARGLPMLFQGQALMQPGWFTDTDPLDWSRKETFSDFYTAFSQLVALRTNAGDNAAGLTGDGFSVFHHDSKNRVIGYLRHNDEHHQDIRVIMNLSGTSLEDYTVEGLPENPTCLFAWQDGLTDTANISLENPLSLPAYTIMVIA
ncbi:alpha-amylase family glycosyl hydrolase [Salinimonas lutimaris]|uniref:alpha-amylase family glycosyl hydrolase n=1 Tax=Salinimonas lutimaris TaxID=914153 RepID=UPI0010BF7EF4|nr:alpha-amylase family glycosyl hydrolase [Salinimonas lutimaris]